MKTVRFYFPKSVIVTSTNDLSRRLEEGSSPYLGFCLLSFFSDTYRMQRIIRFTDSYDDAIEWLSYNDKSNSTYTRCIVLGSDL